jgi:plastocyanin
MTNMKSIISALAAAALVACGGGYGQSPTTPVGDNGRTVTASASLAFGPATLQVHVGDVVTFSFAQVPHNVFFDVVAGAPADIQGNNASVSVTRTFTTAGTYHYNCHIHPGMQGTVQVQ